MQFKKLLKLDEARVELDTVDFDSELFQEYIKRNDIKTKVLNPKGPAGGWPVIEYVGAKRAIEMLIHRFFGDDDLKDLIKEGMDPEEKIIRTYKKGKDIATMKKQEDNSILISYNLTGHKSGAGLKTEFRTANDATRWLEQNGWELDELHEEKGEKWDTVWHTSRSPKEAKLTKITVDVPTVFGADWRKELKSMDNLKKLAELFTDKQDMITIEGYPEVKGNRILFPVYTDVAPDKKEVTKFINAFKEWAKNGALTESAENRKLSKTKISAEHKKILDSGYVYIGTFGRSAFGDDEIVEHNYISKDFKKKKIMSYSAYSLDYDTGPKIKIETVKHNLKGHPHLKESLLHEEEQDSGQLTEATETVQRKRRLAAVDNAHNKMIKDGFIYVKSEDDRDGDGVSHYYVSKDGKSQKVMSYSTLGVTSGESPKIYFEVTKQGKMHPHLKEGLFEEEQDKIPSLIRGQIEEDIGDLKELQEQMTDALEQMEQVLRKYRKEGLYKRAEAYWLAHAKMALTNEHGYLGKNQVSLQDTIEELEEMLLDEDEE